MKAKSIFLWMLLLLLAGWGNCAWAETYITNYSTLTVKNDLTTLLNSGITSSDGLITISFSNVGTDHQADGNNAPYTIKSRGNSSEGRNATITVTGSNSNILISEVVLVYNTDRSYTSEGATISYDSNTGRKTFNYATPATSVSMVNSIGNTNISSIEVTYTDNRTSLTTFAFNSDEVYIHDGTGSGGTYVNGTTFVYDANKTTLRAKLNIDPALGTIGAAANSTYFTVTSSNPAVLNVSGTLSYSSAINDTRVYIDGIQIAGTGNATLTFTFAGSGTYKNTSIDVPISVIGHTITPYSGSYKYTWDFAGGDWSSTIAQLGYGNGSGGYNWTKTVDDTHAEARPTYHTSFTVYDIDMIKGLAFTMKKTSDLCLDWLSTRKSMWMANEATVTIPNLVVGQVVTISADANNFRIPSDSPGKANISGNVFTVTTAGNLKIALTDDTRIYSIAVSNSQYGWAYTTTTTNLDKVRPTSGTFTFTEPGPITGGKEINEVPGIIMTVGAEGDTWEVVEGNGDVNPDFKKTENNETWNIGYVAVCKTAPNARPAATSGCFYTFEALVNGELTIHYYTRSGAYVYNGNTSVTSNNENRIQDITFKVEAGKTYTLEASTGTDQKPSEGIIWLNSFTFTPMFFHPGTTTNQRDYDPAVFPANMNTDKSAFPKLINPSSTEQQNKVKFAGDKEKVYLYKNNDVDLLAAGTNILIRGTVLDKNNEDGLVAYYYLNSYVLTVTSYELADQAYIETSGLTDGNYQIVFSGNVQPADASNIDIDGNGTVTVQVQKDADTPWNVTAHTYANQANLFIPIDPLEAGATYRITVPANAIALTANADTKNSKIERTFSVNAPGEAQVKMIYPTGLATVGTTIVLETYLNGTASNVNNSHKVKGILTGGGTTMPIDATFGTNQLAFKPTSTLQPNTTYTLTIPVTYNNQDNNIYLSTWYIEDVQYYRVTHSKVFTFTTGSSSGTAPYVIANGTTPAEGATVPGSQYSGGTISFEFDQAVELEPYSTVKATPINGSEATASGSTGAPEATNNTLTVGADGKTVSFNYSADGLKYDMYYEVVIPANTVIGAGGLPNASPITLHFRMGMNSNATPVTASSFYPHTWDFNKFGDKTASGTTAYNLVNNYGDPGTADKRKNSLYQGTDQSYTTYKTRNQDGYGFDQGNDVYFYNKYGDKEVMDEFEGIRISLVSSKNDRFEIRNITSLETSNKNADGTDKWQFRMNGNTHYMTLSNVPAGKLYMRVGSNALIGINSPNAYFVDDDKFLATTHESNTKITNTNGTKKLVLNVTEAGDITFCLANFTCEKIAFATDDKTFKSGYAESGKTYATDRLTYDVRYDLLNAFTDHNVKAYYVTGIVDNAEDNTATINAREVTYGVAGADEGVILLYQAGVAVDTNVPVFKADVNSAEQSGQTNELKVIESNTTTVPTPADDCYMYVLSNKGSKSDGVAFYRYTGNTFSDRAAYLEVPKYMVNPSISGGSARVFRMVFYNEDGSETTVIRTVEKDGVTEKAEQAGGYYDLRGQRLAKPNKRGLYIKNGKKVYVK